MTRVLRRAIRGIPEPIRAAFSIRRQVPLVELGDAPSSRERTSSSIPAQLFQTCPSRLIHPAHLEAITTFRAQNRDLSHFVFDQDQADSYMANSWGNHPIKSVYDRCVFGQMKADIFRYCIVFERGGYYLDINKAISANLGSLHNLDDHTLISFEKNSTVVFPEVEVAEKLLFPEKIVLQWSFGFSAQHPILQAAINRVVETARFFEEREFNRILPTVIQFTGPGVLTWSVRKFIAEHGARGIAQHPPDFSERGVTRLPESDHAFRGKRHYSKFKHSRVLESPAH